MGSGQTQFMIKTDWDNIKSLTNQKVKVANTSRKLVWSNNSAQRDITQYEHLEQSTKKVN